MKLWGGRFSKETDSLANDFQSSIGFDQRLYREDIEGSIAHAGMLAACGVISPEDARAIIQGLEAILAADPDFIFVVLQGSDPTDAREALERSLLSNPAWSSLRAVREGRFHTLDHTLYNVKPNARWGEAYEGLADILYPN